MTRSIDEALDEEFGRDYIRKAMVDYQYLEALLAPRAVKAVTLRSMGSDYAGDDLDQIMTDKFTAEPEWFLGAGGSVSAVFGREGNYHDLPFFQAAVRDYERSQEGARLEGELADTLRQVEQIRARLAVIAEREAAAAEPLPAEDAPPAPPAPPAEILVVAAAAVEQVEVAPEARASDEVAPAPAPAATESSSSEDDSDTRKRSASDAELPGSPMDD